VVSTIFFAKSIASISMSSIVHGWLLSKSTCYGSASCQELTRGRLEESCVKAKQVV
jgi:hypothetical protein